MKKDRIAVGDKGLEGVLSDPDNVVTCFKRKMGTSETFRIKTTGQDVSPIELSAMVLKELRASHLGESRLSAAVITVPASFDTVQSAATKRAGEQAGIGQVVLLQEPIAASLAFANKARDSKLGEGRWIVYDLGGGTFDAALVEIRDREMRVVDHEGDNYLGGSDFDRLIVDRLILPRVRAQFGIPEGGMEAFTGVAGKYRAFYRKALRKAEEAKKELSTKSSTEIDGLMFRSDGGDESEVAELRITRSDFETLVRDHIDRTVELVKRILTRHKLAPGDAHFVLMVGGATFSPVVRNRVGELLGIPVRTDIDPVTAIAVGAAYYAATKPQMAPSELGERPTSRRVTVKAAYERFSNEREEMFAARATGNYKGASYRIRRRDGGFDSGIKPLSERINEDLPLESDAFNSFDFIVTDERGIAMDVGLSEITISHGKYRILGQPVTEDICIETDREDGGTKLAPVFHKGELLPARKTRQCRATKALRHGTSDEIHVSVFEGDHRTPASTCKHVGTLTISGQSLASDLRKGAPITVALEMGEDRVIKATVDLETVDKVYSDVFEAHARSLPAGKLRDQASDLAAEIDERLEQCNASENYEVASKLHALRDRAEVLSLESTAISDADTTDARYQCQDRVRELARDLDHATHECDAATLKAELAEAIAETQELLAASGNDYDRSRFADATRTAEHAVLTNSAIEMRATLDSVRAIQYGVMWRTPEFLLGMFANLITHQISRFNDQHQAKLLIEGGRRATEQKDWDKLRDVCIALIRLLPRDDPERFRYQTGIGL